MIIHLSCGFRRETFRRGAPCILKHPTVQMISVVIIKNTRETASFQLAFQLYISRISRRGNRAIAIRTIGEMPCSRALVRKKERTKKKSGGNETRREEGAKFETSVETSLANTWLNVVPGVSLITSATHELLLITWCRLMGNP